MKSLFASFILLVVSCSKEQPPKTQNFPLSKIISITKELVIQEPITTEGLTCNGEAVKIDAYISYSFRFVEKSNGNYQVNNSVTIRGEGITASGERITLQGHSVNTLSLNSSHTIGHFVERTSYKTSGSDGGLFLVQFMGFYDAATDIYTLKVDKVQFSCK